MKPDVAWQLEPVIGHIAMAGSGACTLLRDNGYTIGQKAVCMQSRTVCWRAWLASEHIGVGQVRFRSFAGIKYCIDEPFPCRSTCAARDVVASNLCINLTMVARRLVFLLIDGIGDVALPQLEDLTPLQVAHTPMMDTIAGVPAQIRSRWSLAATSGAAETWYTVISKTSTLCSLWCNRPHGLCGVRSGLWL